MKKFWTITGLAVFAVGALILLYPLIASALSRQRQASVVAAYTQQAAQTAPEALTAQLTAAYAYNASLCRGETPESYDAQLTSADAMAYLEIPAIDVSLPIYHGTDEVTLSRGIGHMASSSLPVGGVGTHCVLSAHNGLPGVTLFTPLEKLVTGDRFFLHVCNQTLTYVVERILVVEPDDCSALTIDPTQDYVTLMTCTPYGVNTHRLLVRGVRVVEESLPAQTDTAAPSRPVTAAERAQYCALALGGCMLSAVLLTLRRSRRKARS